MDGATTDEIIDTVCKCPTQALSYYWNNEKKDESKDDEDQKTQISIVKNGPFIVKGSFKITDAEGNEIACNKSAALCRCGHSKKQPFCDGAHSKANFNIDK